MQVRHFFDDLPRFDRATTEWIATFEGPSVAHLQRPPRQSCAMIDLATERPDAMVADWLGSHEFPTRAFLNTPLDEKPASHHTCRRTALPAARKFTVGTATKADVHVSNLVVNPGFCVVA